MGKFIYFHSSKLEFIKISFHISTRIELMDHFIHLIQVSDDRFCIIRLQLDPDHGNMLVEPTSMNQSFSAFDAQRMKHSSKGWRHLLIAIHLLIARHRLGSENIAHVYSCECELVFWPLCNGRDEPYIDRTALSTIGSVYAMHRTQALSVCAVRI